MSMEQFNKTKSELENKIDEAQMTFNTEELSSLQEQLAKLEATKHTYEEQVESATEIPAMKMDQVNALGGNVEELNEKLVENTGEIQQLESDTEGKVGEVEGVEKKEQDIQENMKEDIEKVDPKVEAYKKFMEDAEKITLEEISNESKGMMLSSDMRKNFDNKNEITVDDFKNLTPDQKQELFNDEIGKSGGLNFLKKQNFLKLLTPDQLTKLIHSRGDVLISVDPELIGNAIDYNTQRTIQIKELEKKKKNSPFNWHKTLMSIKLAEIVANNKDGFSVPIFKEKLKDDIGNIPEKLTEAKIELHKDIEKGILGLRHKFGGEQGLVNFLKSKIIQGNFFKEKSFFDVLQSGENNLVKKQLEQGNRETAFNLIKTYSYMKEKGTLTEEQYSTLVGKPE